MSGVEAAVKGHVPDGLGNADEAPAETDKTAETAPSKPEEQTEPAVAEAALASETEQSPETEPTTEQASTPAPQPSPPAVVHHRLLAFAKVVARRLLHNLAEWIICFQDSFLGGEGGEGTWIASFGSRWAHCVAVCAHG